MKNKIIFILSIFITIFILSSCHNDGDYEGKKIPFSQMYDSYEDMINDFKGYCENYEDFYLDDFKELSPTKYSLTGRCECYHKSDNRKENITHCPNFHDVLPKIIVGDCTITLFPYVENVNVEEILVLYYKDCTNIELPIDRTNNYFNANFYFMYDNKPLISIIGDNDDTNTLLNYIKANYTSNI